MATTNVIKIVYRKVLRILPTRVALYLIYFRGYKKILNIKNPITWGEKIQWLKLYGGLEKLSKYVDKYEVRNYVKNTIGRDYLNELYGVYDDPEKIEYDKLPNKFVLKNTNGSGEVLICKDKSMFDKAKANRTMKRWLKDNYWLEKKEPQYKYIKNRIIVEKYLEDASNSLIDYKFYCTNGKVKYYAIFYDRYTNKTIDVYSADNKAQKLGGVRVCNIPNSNYPNPNKENINKMIELSEKLSNKFSFVRVDFYCVNSQPIFGELTFTDGAGSDSWKPLSFDKKIAKIIPLENVIKRN